MSKTNNDGGMEFLTSLPRRWVTIYIPLIVLLIILLFPFYWMGMTAFKPDAELLSKSGNPFWLINPTLAHFKKLLFHTPYPEWLLNTIIVATSPLRLMRLSPICKNCTPCLALGI